MHYFLLLVILLLSVIIIQAQLFQPTFLDKYVKQYGEIRNIIFKIIGKNSDDPENIKKARSLHLLQSEVPSSVPFPCNVTGHRSSKPPKSVHEVRPGDIDVIAALGDSLSVGNGLVATNLWQVFIENRGLSWSIGGQKTWHEYLTLPNILKEFNPNLIGYSLGDSFTSNRESQFNLAEAATISSELPYMTKVLIDRIKADSRVNLNNHWKLITVLIGVNDFCFDMCYWKNIDGFLQDHRNVLITVFRLLKSNLPRTIINLVPPPDWSRVKFHGKAKSRFCNYINFFECYCIFNKKYENQTEFFQDTIRKWQEVEEMVSNMEEFNQDDFTINYQPFTTNFRIPRVADDNIDLTFLSYDCYHPSQKLNAEGANALWNNMMEKVGHKSRTNYRLFEKFLCPSDQNPYIFTKSNSHF